jgi:N-acetylmuramoyl-L-alanine amidase
MDAWRAGWRARWGLAVLLLAGSSGEGIAGSWGERSRVVTVQGLPSLRLPAVAARYGMQVDVTGLRMTGQGRTLRFEGDSRRVWIDDTLAWMHHPLQHTRHGWALPELDRTSLLDPILAPAAHVAGRGARVVVLDPGHGGEDDGTRGPPGVLEKDLTLAVCRLLASQLANAGPTILLTRETDATLSLAERSHFAATRNADLFLSIHFNAAGNPDAAGIETYLLPPAGQRSTSDQGTGPADAASYPGNHHDAPNAFLAYAVHRRLVQTLQAPDRGIRRARFAVLRDAPCPAILIECGFLSNAAEVARILSPLYQQAAATAIAAGTRDYLNATRSPTQ